MQKPLVAVLISLIILICAATVYRFIRHSDSVDAFKSDVEKIASHTNVSSNPYPLYDLTIPYLRSLTYSSQLGDFHEVATNDAYTSYVTSYTSDGLTINGLLTKPTGSEPKGGWPAIVFIHGYIPPKTYQTQSRYVEYVDSLAKNGFVVFKIDLRGHGDSQGQATGAYYSSDYVKDTLNAYAALQNSDFVNAHKIGVWGHSMAGNISLRAFATKPDIPAVVIWAGAGYTYKDLQDYKITDASYDRSQSNATGSARRAQIRKLYGDPDPSKPFWHDLAPTSYLTDLKGAIQIHHAQDDDTVDVRYSQDLNALLDKTSVEHEYYEYPIGGHNISDPSFSIAMDRTIKFFKQHLE